MEVTQEVMRLKQRWEEYARGAVRPHQCMSCGGPRVWWDGQSWRSVSVRIDDEVVYVSDVRCRRVQCARCHGRWILRPPGIVPRKHYQLDVVAHGAASYLFDVDAALERVAAAVRCSRRTVARWIRWIASLVSPAALLRRLAQITPAPIVPRRPTPPTRRLRHRFAERAAETLTLLEALGTALGAEPPGLRAVLECFGCVPSYAAPALPDPLPVLAR